MVGMDAANRLGQFWQSTSVPVLVVPCSFSTWTAFSLSSEWCIRAMAICPGESLCQNLRMVQSAEEFVRVLKKIVHLYSCPTFGSWRANHTHAMGDKSRCLYVVRGYWEASHIAGTKRRRCRNYCLCPSRRCTAWKVPMHPGTLWSAHHLQQTSLAAICDSLLVHSACPDMFGPSMADLLADTPLGCIEVGQGETSFEVLPTMLHPDLVVPMDVLLYCTCAPSSFPKRSSCCSLSNQYSKWSCGVRPLANNTHSHTPYTT